MPKQFLELGGKSIIAHTVDRFEQHSMIDGIVIVCVESGMEHMREIVDKAHYQKVLRLFQAARRVRILSLMVYPSLIILV